MGEDIHDPTFVADVFDRCAKGYRRWAAIASFGFVTRWRQQCVQALPPIMASRPIVADLMAGTGEVWGPLLKAQPQIDKITAIDISHQMHLLAIQFLHQSKSDKIEHIQANFLTSALPAQAFDAVISSFGVKTLSLDQQAIFAQQLARLLKPEGVFSLIEAADPKGWFLRPLYRVYLDRVLPLIERFLLKGANDFSMLGVYTQSFQDCRYLAECLRSQGLEVIETRYFFGCAWGLSGRKPSRAG